MQMDSVTTTKVARSRMRAAPKPRESVPRLESFYQIEDFQAANQHVFPSVPSLRWFVRCHKSELIKAKAIALLAGRLMVHAANFETALIEIGTQSAATR
jgi:hypothetical protein